MRLFCVLTSFCITTLLNLSIVGPEAAAAENVGAEANGPPPSQVPTVSFFQLSAVHKKAIPSYEWQFLLKAASELKYDSIIIQHVQEKDHGGIAPFDAQHAAEGEYDVLEQILIDADALNIKVHVGLMNDPTWASPENFNQPETLKRALDAVAPSEIDLAERLAAKYGNHVSFAGWYMPLEFYAFSFNGGDLRSGYLHDFLLKISTSCKAKKNVPFSISAFRGEAPPRSYSDVIGTYTRILDGSGVDEVFVQDQVGEVGLTCAEVEQLYSAFKNACSSSRVTQGGTTTVRFSPLVELFERTETNRRLPCHIDRLRQQVKLASASHPERICSFDFFHYMNPVTKQTTYLTLDMTNDDPDDFRSTLNTYRLTTGSQSERRRLFADFQRWLNPSVQSGDSILKRSVTCSEDW